MFSLKRIRLLEFFYYKILEQNVNYLFYFTLSEVF